MTRDLNGTVIWGLISEIREGPSASDFARGSVILFPSQADRAGGALRPTPPLCCPEMNHLLRYSLSLILIIGVSPILCRLKCSRPVLPNGRARIKSKGLIVQFKCFRGYSMLGEPYAACLRGKWEPEPPVCLKTGCTPIRSLRNGFINESNGKALLEFSCKPGYKLIGPSFIYCNGREWSSMPPYCKASDISCNFEGDDTCSWAVDAHDDDDFMWHVHSHKSVSRVLGTGPEHDHTFATNDTGHYLMIETSDYGTQVLPARIHSPKFPVPSTNNSCFIFWYHMFGSTVGMLNVFLNNKPVFQARGNHGDRWIKGIVPLIQNATDLQLMIEGTHGKGNTGDIGLDDFSIGNSSDCEFTRVTSCEGRCNGEIPDTASCLCTPECFVDSSCCDDFKDYCSSEISTTETSESSDYEIAFTENSDFPLETESESNNFLSSSVTSELEFTEETTLTPQLIISQSVPSGGHELTETSTNPLQMTPSSASVDLDYTSFSDSFSPIKITQTSEELVRKGTEKNKSDLYLDLTDNTISSFKKFTKLTTTSSTKNLDEINTLPNDKRYTTVKYVTMISQKYDNGARKKLFTEKNTTQNFSKIINEIPSTISTFLDTTTTIPLIPIITQTNVITTSHNNTKSTLSTTMPTTVNHFITKKITDKPFTKTNASVNIFVSNNVTVNPLIVTRSTVKRNKIQNTTSSVFLTTDKPFIVKSSTETPLVLKKISIHPYITKSKTDIPPFIKPVTADPIITKNTTFFVSKSMATSIHNQFIKIKATSPFVTKYVTATPVFPKITTTSRLNNVTINPFLKKLLTITPNKPFKKKLNPFKYFTQTEKHNTKSTDNTTFVNVTTSLNTLVTEVKKTTPQLLSFNTTSKLQLITVSTPAIYLTSLKNPGFQKEGGNSKTAQFNNVLKTKVSRAESPKAEAPSKFTGHQNESNPYTPLTESIKIDNNTDVNPESFSNPKGNFHTSDVSIFSSDSNVKEYLVPGIILITVFIVGIAIVFFFTKRRSQLHYRNGSEGDVLYISSEEMFDFNLARPSSNS